MGNLVQFSVEVKGYVFSTSPKGVEIMEGYVRPQGMTDEELAEAERVFEVSRRAAEEELWRMACLTAQKKDHELLGQTEFQMRDILMRIGARALEASVNERRKKGVPRQ
ncbi:MAG: hypothetical protein JJ992_02840 [Planctomycetes bacterium]|nr:hypothetical protein [Planctomycetota bacterium]